MKEIGMCALCKAIIYDDDSGRVETNGVLFCTQSCSDEINGIDPVYCAECNDEIPIGSNYLEVPDPDHGEPVQFCGSDCAGAYLVKKMCVSKTVCKEE
jgi:hypothetical protein